MSQIAGRSGGIPVDLTGFPADATLTGKVWRLFLEPVVGSGERIIAGVLARTETGETCRMSALNPQTLDCVYGAHGRVLARYADELLRAADSQLARDPQLANWKPHYGGFTLSDPLDAQGDSAKEIARGEIMMGASFALRRGHYAESEEEVTEKRAEHTVRQIVVEQKEHLKANFFRKHYPFGSSKTLTIFFSSNRIIANMAKCTPATIANADTRTKAKMLELMAVRDDAEVPGGGSENLYQMLLLTPPFTSELFTQRQRKNYQNAIDSLITIGDREQIRVKQTTSATALASHILANA